MGPRDFKQISQYIGSNIEVEFKDGRLATGVLSFFNYEQQIIHISDYSLKRPEEDGYSEENGEMLIINSKEWRTIQVAK